MPKPIRQYTVLQFDSPEIASEFARAIMDFKSKPEGIAYMASDSKRPVIWAASMLKPNASVLYVSDGALEIANALRIPNRPGQKIDREKLPADRTLLLGDAADWRDDETDSRTNKAR